MSVSTIELYNALIEAGVDKEKAEAASKAVISREEAKTLATKADINSLRAEMYKGMTVQALAIVGGVVGLLQLVN